jgi:hypothetical protein
MHSHTLIRSTRTNEHTHIHTHTRCILPEGFKISIPQMLHAGAWLCTRHRPHRLITDLPLSFVKHVLLLAVLAVLGGVARRSENSDEPLPSQIAGCREQEQLPDYFLF